MSDFVLEEAESACALYLFTACLQIVQVRASLDSIDNYHTKVLPSGGQMLYSTVGQAINTEEPDWEKPKEGSIWQTAWGSQRTILFAGLS